MFLNSLHTFYEGVGAGEISSSLPMQTLPDSKKNDIWKKNTMDRLEQIALSQISRNLEFRDYYKMVEGRLVYSDFEAPPEIVKDIASLRQEMDLPTYLRHYDLIGLMANQLLGELDTNKDKLRIDSIDEFSQNEFIREKSERLNEYMKSKFDLEVKRRLAAKGLNPENVSQFETDEEKQQYMQFIQEESAKLVNPEQIERELSKDFKVKAAEWGERTFEADQERFNMEHLEEQEFMDYFLTGRFFRHYHVGYDFYKPETWKVETTFFSEEVDTEFPQDGEYVGRLHYLSASEVLVRYGNRLSHDLQQQIGKVFDNTSEEGISKKTNITNLAGQRAVGNHIVPDRDYYARDLTIELQEAFGVPAGISTYTNEAGQTVHAPDWLSDYSTNDNYFGPRYAAILRDDISIRRDLFRVTEAYFRSFKRIGYLRYLSTSGVVVEEIVDDTLLKDFLKENNIKKIKKISLDDFEKGDEVNVIAYFYIPEIWKGKKIGAAGAMMSEDIYFDVEPLEYQIKGDSNIFDVKLPVAGIVTSSKARKIRPYQMGYNICMNQIFNLLEKEIGMFFLMDINFLPSEFKDMGDSAELLAELRGMARDFGFLPVDTSRQNLAGQNPQAGYFQKQDVSYDAQINRRAIMADMYKRLALEQIGITEQRKAGPDKYQTAEGIKVGQEASYAQTRGIYSKFNNARKKATELHLNVAQYCQGEGKDISIFTRRSDGDHALLEFSDELFPLRQLGVTAVSNSKSRKGIENLRSYLLNNNTAGSDILDFANIMMADSLVELRHLGEQSRLRQERLTQEERQHEIEINQMQIDAEKEAKETEYQREAVENQKDRDNEIEVEEIKALGRASDKQSDMAGMEQIKAAADIALADRESQQNFELKSRDLDIKEEGKAEENRLKQAEIRLKIQELKERRADRKSADYRATINKN